MLNDILVQFTDAIGSGIVNVRPFANRLLFLLLTFDIIIFGYKIALGQFNDIPSIAWKLLTLGILYYLVINIDYFAFMFQNSIMDISSKVGGNNPRAMLITPDGIIDFAHKEILRPVHALYDDLGRLRAKSIGTYVMLGTTEVVVMMSFVLIAVQLILAIIEFYIMVLFSVILVPFVVFEPTKFIGTKPFGAIVGGAIKLGAIMVVTGITINLLRGKLYFPDGPGSVDMPWTLGIMVVSLLAAFVSMQIPGIASSLLSGVPSMSAGGAFQNAAALGASIGAMGMRAKAVGSAAIKTPGAIKTGVQGLTRATNTAGRGIERAGAALNKIFKNTPDSGLNPMREKPVTPSGGSANDGFKAKV